MSKSSATVPFAYGEVTFEVTYQGGADLTTAQEAAGHMVSSLKEIASFVVAGIERGIVANNAPSGKTRQTIVRSMSVGHVTMEVRMTLVIEREMPKAVLAAYALIFEAVVEGCMTHLLLDVPVSEIERIASDLLAGITVQEETGRTSFGGSAIAVYLLADPPCLN